VGGVPCSMMRISSSSVEVLMDVTFLDDRQALISGQRSLPGPISLHWNPFHYISSHLLGIKINGSPFRRTLPQLTRRIRNVKK